MSRIREVAARQSAAWNGLQEQWQTTRSLWRDGVAAGFERRYWTPWQELMPRLLRTLRSLDEVIDVVSRDSRK